MSEQLTLKTLEEELKRLRETHGDMPVILDDADTGWRFKLQAKHLEIENANHSGHKRLVISVPYSDELYDCEPWDKLKGWENRTEEEKNELSRKMLDNMVIEMYDTATRKKQIS